MAEVEKALMKRRLLDVEGIADYLGVTVRHVRRLVLERRIPFIKWGHLLRFDLDEIDAWIDGWRQAPVVQPMGTGSVAPGDVSTEDEPPVSERPRRRTADRKRPSPRRRPAASSDSSLW